MQSRTFLRIEGDLVSLVTEVIDREVTLPDLLTELTSSQLAITPRLPTGCRFWLRAGTTDRCVFVVEQPPGRRTIEYHVSRRYDAEPTTYRLALPYVVFVVSTYGDQIEGVATYFRTEPIGSLDANALLLDPAEHLRRRARLPGIGQGQRGQRRRAGRRPDRRVLGEPLQPGSPAPPAAVQRRLPGLGDALAAGSARGPVHRVRPLLALPAPGRRPDGRARGHGPAEPAPDPGATAETEVRTPDPTLEAGDDADALAS